jgi:uncharacterized membrane protein
MYIRCIRLAAGASPTTTSPDHTTNHYQNTLKTLSSHTGENMSEVHIWIAIERPIEQVWSLLGGFDWLPRWVEVIASSRLSDSGRLRHLKTTDGAVIVERLLTFDENEKYYSYALLEGPSPVTDYVGTMSAQSDGNGRTLASWSSTFQVLEADEAQVVARLEALYRNGLERLKAIVEAMD